MRKASAPGDVGLQSALVQVTGSLARPYLADVSAGARKRHGTVKGVFERRSRCTGMDRQARREVMDSDQVFDHRKFDSGALQSGTAPTDTPRYAAVLRSVAKHILAGTVTADEVNDAAEKLETLERELSAARAEADELARRVAHEYLRAAHRFVREAQSQPGLDSPDLQEIIARVRAEMEKEKGNG